MAFWQYPWHITVARLRRILTGFPCSARSSRATKPICSFQAKEKPHRQTLRRRDRLFSLPAFLQPISGPRFGAHTWSVFWLAHFGGFLRQRPHPAFSVFPNDRIAPLRVRTFAHTATGIARISTGSLISTPELSQPTQNMGHHAAIELLKYVLLCHTMYDGQKPGSWGTVSLRKTLDESQKVHIRTHSYKVIIS